MNRRCLLGVLILGTLFSFGTLALTSRAGGLEEKFLFYPAKYPKGDWRPQDLTFEDVFIDVPTGLQVELINPLQIKQFKKAKEFRFVEQAFRPEDDNEASAVTSATTVKGPVIHAWYVPCENARAVVLYSHGNGGNLSYCTHALRDIHNRLRVAILIYDYEGYGRSLGKPSQKAILADARAARGWLARKEQVPECDIVLWGQSLGGGVSVQLAAHDGARGLVLESTFTSIEDMAKKMMPLLPTGPFVNSPLDSEKLIGQYHGPLLHSHGDADGLIPFSQGERLFKAANEPKQFVRIERGGHNDPRPPGYYAYADRFISELPEHGSESLTEAKRESRGFWSSASPK